MNIRLSASTAIVIHCAAGYERRGLDFANRSKDAILNHRWPGFSRGTVRAKAGNPALRGPRHFAPGNDRPGQDRGTAWAKAPRRSIGASGIRVSRLCPPCGCASLALNEAAAREGQMRADQMGFLRIVMPLWLIVGA